MYNILLICSYQKYKYSTFLLNPKEGAALKYLTINTLPDIGYQNLTHPHLHKILLLKQLCDAHSLQPPLIMLSDLTFGLFEHKGLTTKKGRI